MNDPLLFAPPATAPLTASDGPLAALAQRIASAEAVVGVIGLGYVGLPLACTIAEAGMRVIGFDFDDAKIAAMLRGES